MFLILFLINRSLAKRIIHGKHFLKFYLILSLSGTIINSGIVFFCSSFRIFVDFAPRCSYKIDLVKNLAATVTEQ